MNQASMSLAPRLAGLALAGLLGLPTAHGAPLCRSAEIRFAPGSPDLQIVVWIEDSKGTVVDTAYITRLTGQFGLANRPGEALLKTDFRWPFSRREMVAPVWAHRRNKRYPKVVMGGACGNSPNTRCPDGTLCGGDCEDSTIAYHPRVSSYEPFYCSPSGRSKLDALSCASKGTFPKGAYADPPAYSLYPPRADLNAHNPAVDGADMLDFARQNDLVAISRATPPPGKVLSPAVSWFPKAALPDGNYVAWIELSQESDFNAHHNHPNRADSVKEWDFEGRPFLGQPSVVYKVPFVLDRRGGTYSTRAYAGYGAWDGRSGTLTAPDGTISDQPGTGAGRLLDLTEGGQSFRLQVVVGGCGPIPDGGVPMDGGVPCQAPDAATHLELVPSPTAIQVSFRGPAAGVAAARYAVRYREGDTPITEASFDTALAAPDLPPPSSPGESVSVRLPGLVAERAYTVAVRSYSACNLGSPVLSRSTATPRQAYTTLNGCFVATAAFGSPLAPSVDALRRLRDRRLLHHPAGQLLVASYYALSPPLAEAIAEDRRLRSAARGALSPLVELTVRLP